MCSETIDTYLKSNRYISQPNENSKKNSPIYKSGDKHQV